MHSVQRSTSAGPHRAIGIVYSDWCGKRKERQSVLGPTLPDPTANDGAETRSPCVAISGETTLHRRSRGHERPSGR